MKIKIIFIDIDGTIRSDKKRISLKTRYIIKKLTKKGIIIVICSGRNRNFTKNISLLFTLVCYYDKMMKTNKINLLEEI